MDFGFQRAVFVFQHLDVDTKCIADFSFLKHRELKKCVSSLQKLSLCLYSLYKNFKGVGAEKIEFFWELSIEETKTWCTLKIRVVQEAREAAGEKTSL